MKKDQLLFMLVIMASICIIGCGNTEIESTSATSTTTSSVSVAETSSISKAEVETETESKPAIVTQTPEPGDTEALQNVYDKGMEILDLMDKFEIDKSTNYLDIVTLETDLNTAIGKLSSSGTDASIVAKAKEIYDASHDWSLVVTYYKAGQESSSNVTLVRDRTKRAIDEFVELVNG